MASGLLVTQAILVLSWAFGIYGVWYLLLNNGGFDKINQVLAKRPPMLPGTMYPLKTSYTSLKIIDDQLSLLNVFFWEAFDGSMPNLSLFAFAFGGQIASVYLLVLVEGARFGNRGRIVSFPSVLGSLGQSVAFACALPLYALLHLGTSPTAYSVSATDVAIDVAGVALAPLSILIGFIGPAIVMSLPAPSLVSLELKQNFMAIWTLFPLTVGILQLIFSFSYTRLPKVESGARNSSSIVLKTLRFVYIVALALAGVTRVAILSVIVLNTFFPGLFIPIYRDIFTTARVLKAASFTTVYRPATVGEAQLLLLQFDEQAFSLALMTWSVYLYLRADNGSKSFGRWLSLAGILVIANVLAGPAGVAIAALWGRDELVLGRSDKLDSKKNE